MTINWNNVEKVDFEPRGIWAIGTEHIKIHYLDGNEQVITPDYIYKQKDLPEEEILLIFKIKNGKPAANKKERKHLKNFYNIEEGFPIERAGDKTIVPKPNSTFREEEYKKQRELWDKFYYTCKTEYNKTNPARIEKIQKQIKLHTERVETANKYITQYNKLIKDIVVG